MTTCERTRQSGNPRLPSGEHLDDAVAAVSLALESRLRPALTGTCPGVDADDLLPLLTGGKLLRSRLTILIAQALGASQSKEIVRACVAVELVHTASLVHDDIIDDSLTRRGLPTVQRSTNPATAILLGDLLLALAFEEVAPLGTEATAAVAHAFTQLCVGQLAEPGLTWGTEAQPSIELYARRKTGGLFGASVELAALAAGLQAPRASRLRASGELLGIAFQLADDLIDVQHDLSELNKDHGADLRNGIPTLPIWHAYHALRMAGVDPEEPEWSERLGREAGSPAARTFTLQRISELVDASQACLPDTTIPALVDSAVSIVLSALPEYAPRDPEGPVR